MKYFLFCFFFSVSTFYMKDSKKDPNLVPSNLISKEIPEFSIESLQGKKFHQC